MSPLVIVRLDKTLKLDLKVIDLYLILVPLCLEHEALLYKLKEFRKEIVLLVH